MAKTNPLHWHVCWCCERPLICACNDRRQNDRETGQERRILCFACADMDCRLTAALLNERLERVQ